MTELERMMSEVGQAANGSWSEMVAALARIGCWGEYSHTYAPETDCVCGTGRELSPRDPLPFHRQSLDLGAEKR